MHISNTYGIKNICKYSNYNLKYYKTTDCFVTHSLHHKIPRVYTPTAFIHSLAKPVNLTTMHLKSYRIVPLSDVTNIHTSLPYNHTSLSILIVLYLHKFVRLLIAVECVGIFLGGSLIGPNKVNVVIASCRSWDENRGGS